MIIPRWFKKELSTIDKTYRCEECPDHDGFFIIKDIDLTMKTDGGKSLTLPEQRKNIRVYGPCIILWINEPAQFWLDKLRAMKLKGIELGIFDNPVNELAYYQKLKKDAKAKKAELAVDMISEGLMEAHRLSRKKSFSYGGS